MDNELEEKCIRAWINLTGLLKNTRLTKGLIYNEANVMLLLYQKFLKDGDAMISFKDIVTETHMLKSLVNRTVDSLVKKGYIERLDGETDRRTTYVRALNFEEYLKVHRTTLDMVHSIIETIGREDAETFIRISRRIVENSPL